MLGVADEGAAAPLIDMAWPADLTARVQADLLSRMAEETIAAFGLRTRLIPYRAGARLAVAHFFGEILAPREALAAAEYVTVRAARTERIVWEAPRVWWARFARIPKWLADASVGTNLTGGTIESIATISAKSQTANLVTWTVITAAAFFAESVPTATKLAAVLLAAVFDRVTNVPTADFSLRA